MKHDYLGEDHTSWSHLIVEFTNTDLNENT